MQTQAYNWPSAWVEIVKQLADLGKIVIPVTVTAIVSWKIARHQLTLKNAEFEAQARLRARELIFDVHRRELEKRRDQADQTMGSFGTMRAHIQDLEKEGRIGDAIQILKTHQSMLRAYAGSNLEYSLKKYDLMTDEKARDLESIDRVLTTDLTTIVPAQISAEDAHVRLVEIYQRVQAYITEILEKSSYDLFDQYLPNSVKKQFNTSKDVTKD